MRRSFEDQLAKLVAEEMGAARGDHDRMAAVIERLSAALGFSIAITSQGDPQMIDTLMHGAERYAHEEAVSKARIARLIKSIRPDQHQGGGRG